MKSIIYLELTKEISYHYPKEFLATLKELLPEVDTFDLDNHSEPLLFNYAIDLIRKSDQCVVIFKTEQEASSGKAMLLLEEILKNKSKLLFISICENKFVEKISRQLPNFKSYQSPELTDTNEIINFLKTEL